MTRQKRDGHCRPKQKGERQTMAKQQEKYPVLIPNPPSLTEQLHRAGLGGSPGDSASQPHRVELTGHMAQEEFHRIAGEDADMKDFLNVRTEGPESWEVNFHIDEVISEEHAATVWQDVVIQALMERERETAPPVQEIKAMALPRSEMTLEAAAALVSFGQLQTDYPEQVSEEKVLELADSFELKLEDLARPGASS